MPFSMDDTITATATAPGRGAIGVVRISGPSAWNIGLAIFRSKSGGLKRIKPRYLYYGHVVNPANSEQLDEALAVFFRGPHTYTAEDMIEIQSHGSPLILRRITELALAQGARSAEPGEFTLRAFLNGRIDLAQAEAIADLVSSSSDAAIRQSLHQLEGTLSRQTKLANDAILRAMAPIEASIDFPEEEVPPVERRNIQQLIQSAQSIAAELLSGAERGRIAREGISCVIAGRPNAGKSSLFNALLQMDRAIVTAMAGTTRDTLEETALLGGVAVRLTDTAGITEIASDEAEAIGVQRSKTALDNAEIAILVIDSSLALCEEDTTAAHMLAEKGYGAARRPIIAALNKADMPHAVTAAALRSMLDAAGVQPFTIIETSAVEKTGLRELETAITQAALGDQFAEHAPIVARARHRDALLRASEALAEAQQTLISGAPLDFVAEDLREASARLSEITGFQVTEDLLTIIFRDFCIGK